MILRIVKASDCSDLVTYDFLFFLPFIDAMEKFMLLIREDLKRMQASTEEERVAEMVEMFEWIKPIATSGSYVTSDRWA